MTIAETFEIIISENYPFLELEGVTILYEPYTMSPIYNIKIKGIEELFRMESAYIKTKEEKRKMFDEKILPHIRIKLRKKKIDKINDIINKI